MRLSTKSRYGTRAMVEIARLYPNTAVKRKMITEAQMIPDSYLENILVSLKESGLVLTIRGAKGGYQLAKPPEEITVLMIVEALEGPIKPVPCIDTEYHCRIRENCSTAPVWEEMYSAVKDVLKGYTLSDLTKGKTPDTYHDFMI